MNIHCRFTASLLVAGARQRHTNPLGPSRNKPPPPWAVERLLAEGHSQDDILSNWEQLTKRRATGWMTAFTNKIHRFYDISPQGIKDMIKKNAYEQFKASQSINLERESTVGPDISAAMFVLERGGAVRFKNHRTWLEGDSVEIRLPTSFDKSFLLEAIDMRDFQIMYRGFANFSRCKHLVSLKLVNQHLVDDWCLDAVSGMFGATLEYFDVSGCQRITEKGLSCLHRCRNLKLLNVFNLPNVKNPELLCILLEEALPMAEIQGISYSNRN